MLARSGLRDGAALLLSIALGVWLFWPTLELGLFADDYTAAAMADGRFAAPRGAFDLFDFANGTPGDVRALRRLGSIPWWAPDDYRVSFLRPLSSALVHADRALFGDALWAYHAHSIAAWALLVVAASALYRRLFSPGVAALATLMFAIDDSQHFPVLWLSNRGGIYAVLFGVLGLLAHLRYRERGLRRDAWLSALWLGTALLFGEWAFPMFAYVLGYELLAARDAWRARAIALLPAALLGLAFLCGRAWLGYGARGSGAYVDPAAEPAHFALALVQRIPVLVSDMIWNVPAAWFDHGAPWRDRILGWGVIPPWLWERTPGWPFFHIALGLLAFAAIFWMLRATWGALSTAERSHLRWLLCGALLALVPVVGSFLSTRLTLAAFLGVAPLFALMLRHIGRTLLAAPRVRAPRWFASYALGVAIAYLQLLSPLRENIQAQVDECATTTQWVLHAQLDPQRVAQQRVIMLASAEFTTTFFFAYIWGYHGRPPPLAFHPISTAPYAHDIDRVADNALIVRTLGGSFLDSGLEVMFHERARKLHVGQSVRLDGLRVQVESVVDGVAQALRLVFDRSVDDPAYVFLVSGRHGIERVPPPALGATLRLPRASPPNWMKLQRFRDWERVAPPPDLISFRPAPPFVDYLPGGG